MKHYKSIYTPVNTRAMTSVYELFNELNKASRFRKKLTNFNHLIAAPRINEVDFESDVLKNLKRNIKIRSSARHAVGRMGYFASNGTLSLENGN